MNNDKKRSNSVSQPQGAELANLIKFFGRNREAGISELTKMDEAIRSINRNKAAMSADKRAGFIFEEVVTGTYNAAARKAGDFNTTAKTGYGNGFGIDPRVDIQVVRRGKVIAEAQAKCCVNPARSAVSISKTKYAGTERIVPAGQAQPVREMLNASAKGKANSVNPRMREIGTARQEASGKVAEQLKAGGHKSGSLSHKDAIKMANGDTSKISQMIGRETMTSAAVSGARSGAAFSGGLSALTSAYKVANGKMSAQEAIKTVATETVIGGLRSATTNLVAEGVKKVATGGVLRGAAPLAVAGCVMDVVSDAWKGELTAKSAAKSATRAAGGWAGAECGALLGTAIFPGIGTVIGGLLGGTCGSLLGGAW